MAEAEHPELSEYIADDICEEADAIVDRWVERHPGRSVGASQARAEGVTRDGDD